jgi:glutamate racemase
MAQAQDSRLLVFDSGLGGLTVLDAVRQALPQASVRYLADDAGFPYGGWAEDALIERVVAVIGADLARQPADAVIIACNTASTLVLPALRQRLSIPVIGTVPAIKPAAEQTHSGLVSVLATPGTVRRDYTKALIATYAADIAITLVGATGLAALAEAEMRGDPASDAAILAEIEPCFVSREADGARTDVVVLACTHYPLLLQRFARIAPWPVMWIDPAPAIARRVVSVLGAQQTPVGRTPAMSRGEACFTSGRQPGADVARALAARGLIVNATDVDATDMAISRALR